MTKEKIHEALNTLDEVKNTVNTMRKERGEEPIIIDTEYVLNHLGISGKEGNAIENLYFLKEEMNGFEEDYLSMIMDESGTSRWMKSYVYNWADILVESAITLRQNPLWARRQVTRNLTNSQNINAKFLLKDFNKAYHIAIEEYLYRFPTEWDK